MHLRRPCPARHQPLVAALLALGCLAPAAPAAAATRYVFAVFKGDSVDKEKLSIYTSTDGLNFKLLADTGYGGPTGVLRDPSIMKHTDGKYYVAHTVQSWDTNSSSFAIASSPDLLKWTAVTTVDTRSLSPAHTWAPEWFKDDDGSVNLIVNLDQTTAEWSFRSYRFTATDDTLTKWSAPTAIGIGPNTIDTFVVKVDSTYHAFTKNETTKYIEHATATRLDGPWTWVGKDDWAGWGSGKEGPALFRLASGDWRIIMDRYSGGGCLYATSSDLTRWSAVTEIPGGLSGVVRHGTILREDDTPDAGVADVAAEAGADLGADLGPPDARDAVAERGFDVAGAGGTSGAGGGTSAVDARASGGAGGGSATGGRTGGAGGATGAGGRSGSGGVDGSGGASASGGASGLGGTATGGVVSTGGTTSTRPPTGDAAPGSDARAAGGQGGSGTGAASSGCSCVLGGRLSAAETLLGATGVLLALLRRRRRG